MSYKRILLTGANGFLGKIITQQLNNVYTIDTMSRSASMINCDLVLNIPKLSHHYDIVIHAAGKAHSVPKTDLQKQDFYNINVTGTKNLLIALEQSQSIPRSFVFISSVAVYGKDSAHLIAEDTNLLAKDPYGESKIQAENMVEAWCAKNKVICTILRLPLLAGANPPGNLKAMINGIKKGYYFNIAGGKTKKSIVMASDVARIIPTAAAIGGTYNLTDRHHPSFLDLSILIAHQLGKSNPLNMPLFIARLLGKVGDTLGGKAPMDSRKLSKIISDLTFDDSKAVFALNWKPTPVLQGFKING